jgi:HEAT repeat protein
MRTKAATLFWFLAFVTCISPAAAQDLQVLLSRFQSEHDRAAKETILLNITTSYPNAGSALLRIARETEDTDTRWIAIRGIGYVKYRDASPFLRQSLNSKSNYVRANSARALGEIHDESASSDLIRALENEQDRGVIEQTALALQMLGAKEALPALKAKAENPSAQTRVWILGAIETLGSGTEVPFFATFLFDKDESVASFAASAIRGFRNQRIWGD